jgi:hypothetical protein
MPRDALRQLQLARVHAGGMHLAPAFCRSEERIRQDGLAVDTEIDLLGPLPDPPEDERRHTGRSAAPPTRTPRRRPSAAAPQPNGGFDLFRGAAAVES